MGEGAVCEHGTHGGKHEHGHCIVSFEKQWICRQTSRAGTQNIDASKAGDQTVISGGILSMVKGYVPSKAMAILLVAVDFELLL